MINDEIIKKQIACPYGCNEDALLKKRPQIVKHKGLEKIIELYYYECKKCNGSFTTTQSDTISLSVFDY
jgi:DNA-directed RNA polymerase subunit RPC12/RpoP